MLIVCLFWAQQPPVGQGLVIHEVSKSRKTTQHSRQDSSGREIISSQIPLPDNTQHSQQTSMPPVGIRTHNLNKRVAADLPRRQLGVWYIDIVSFYLNG